MNRPKLPYVIVSAFYLLAFSVLLLTIQRVEAAAVTVTLTPSVATASTQTAVSVAYGAGGTFSAGQTITVTWSAGVTLANASSPTTDADGDATPDGSAGVVSQAYTYTFSAPTTTNTITLAMRVTAAAGNYNAVVTDSRDNYGGALLYVGSANVVSVTADVQPSLAFAIRNSTDTTNTNTCALGTLALISVSTCSYRLKITTNSGSGYVIQIASDGDLRKTGGSGDAYNIDAIATHGTVTAGTEGYGIALVGGSATSGATVTESGNFSSDDNPVPASATDIISVAGSNNPSTPDTTNSSLVTHRAAMDADTTTGHYTQAVTYTVTATF